jgi:secretion/DNA translocation related TadE-like protein
VTRDRGAASIWVIVCCALVAAVAYVGVLRGSAVLARHRVETAADLAALAAAGRIGVAGDPCKAAAEIAAANGARIVSCTPFLAADARSGSVRVQVVLAVRFAVVGVRSVVASARAGRAVTPGHTR